VNRRRGEPALRRIGVKQAVDLGEQVMVNVVRPSGSGIGRLNKVFYRPVGDHPVECPVPINWYRAVVEEVDVEIFFTAAPHLFGRDGDPDSFGSTLLDSLQKRPVPTTDVQYASAWLASNLVQQVVELVSLGLFIRRLWITVINPLGQVEQPAGREESISGRVTGSDLFPMSLGRARIGRWMRVCNSHVAPA